MKRLWTSLAVLGCLIQAIVLPLHASVRAADHHNAARLATELGVICGVTGTTAASDPVAAADHDVPLEPPHNQPSHKSSEECPICKSTAAFTLALAAVVLVGLVPERARPVFARPDDDVARAGMRLEPRSRGPPTLV